MQDIGKPSAGSQINTLQNRLVMAQSDLAVLDEQRENTKREIDAIRNYLNGVRLGQQQAVEAIQAEPEPQQESAGGTD